MCENVMTAVKKVLLKMYEGVNSVVLPASIYTLVIHPYSICPASKTLPRNILGSTWSWVTRFRLNRSVKMTFSATGRALRFEDLRCKISVLMLSILKGHRRCWNIPSVIISWWDWHIWVILDTLLKHFSCWNYVGINLVHTVFLM